MTKWSKTIQKEKKRIINCLNLEACAGSVRPVKIYLTASPIFDFCYYLLMVLSLKCEATSWNDQQTMCYFNINWSNMEALKNYLN